MMRAKETNTTAVQTTTHYWGYRELDIGEINCVGGGYDGDGDTMNDFGGGGEATAETQAAVDSLYGLDPSTEASLGCNLVGFGVTAALASRGVSPVASGIAGLLAQQACENLTASNGSTDSLSAAWGGHQEDNTR